MPRDLIELDAAQKTSLLEVATSLAEAKIELLRSWEVEYRRLIVEQHFPTPRGRLASGGVPIIDPTRALRYLIDLQIDCFRTGDLDWYYQLIEREASQHYLFGLSYKQLILALHAFETTIMNHLFETLPSNIYTRCANSLELISHNMLSIIAGVYFGETIAREHELRQIQDEFLMIASHELRTPVTSIKGFTQLLAKKIQRRLPYDQMTHDVQIITEQVERLAALVNELVDAARLGIDNFPLKIEETEFRRFIGEILARIAPVFADHPLEFNVPSQEMIVKCDLLRVEQVLGNLVMNAVKFSPAGRTIQVNVLNTEVFAEVEVRDMGVGIVKEQQLPLFERFYRAAATQRRIGGLGLGLYISRQIINRHGGEMWLQSEQGSGSSFFFSLPLAEKQIKPASELPADASSQ